MGKAAKAKLSNRLASASSPSKVYDSGSVMTISGFHIVPLSVASSSSSSSSSSSTHYLYIKAHDGASSSKRSLDASSSETLPRDRTLFIVNLPVDATEKHLRTLFAKAGRIEEVRFRRRSAGSQEEGQEEDGAETPDSESSGVDDEAVNEPSSVNVTASKKKQKKKQAKAPTIPPLHPLPPLNPRKSAAFLETASSAHIIFLEPSSVPAALNLIKTGKIKRWTDPYKEAKKSLASQTQAEEDDEESSSGRRKPRPQTALEAQASQLLSSPAPPTGLPYFLSLYDHLRPSLPSVKSHADSTIARYTFFRSHPALDPERGTRPADRGGIKIASYGPNGEPLDEDGFTIVVAGGKYGRSLGSTAATPGTPGINTGGVKISRAIKSLPSSSTTTKAQDKMMPHLEDFYRFQSRERKRDQLAELRRKFALDQKRIEEMKGSSGAARGERRFKPY